MLEEGASPRQIDTAVRAFGMAIGEYCFCTLLALFVRIRTAS
jgi:3-hydroxyacyl-CoA dehydrogenase